MVGLEPLHFSSKDFEILDLDPPNNPTSHYGTCHFGYNLALRHKIHFFEVAYFVVGQGLVPLHFSSKDFEILDLDPPNNPTSHYGACHFGYNLVLSKKII